jgi:hypothetical protein
MNGGTLVKAARTLIAIALLDGLLLAAGMAQSLTLQAPLSRVGHGFSLWYYHWENSAWVGYQYYPDSIAVQPAGVVDANGQYQLAPNSYLELTFPVDPFDDCTYALIDATTGEYSAWSTDDLRSTPWTVQDAMGAVLPSTWLTFSIPASRYEHALNVVLDDGTSYPLSTGAVLGYNGEEGYVSYGFFTAWAQAETFGLPFRVVDLTTNEQAPAGATDLRSAAWVPIDVPTALHSATVVLPMEAVTFAYTFHTSRGSLQGVSPHWDSVWSPTLNAQIGGYVLSGSVSAGEEFWVTRDVDGKPSPRTLMLFQNQVVDWSAFFPPAPNLQTLTFQIGQAHYDHVLAVQYDDDTLSYLYLADWDQYWGNFHVSYDSSGATFSYYYSAHQARVNVDRSWSLINVTTGENYGAVQSLMTGYDPNQPLLPQPGAITVTINSDRAAHTFHTRQNGATHQIVPGSDPPTYFSDWNWYFVGTPNERWAETRYFQANAWVVQFQDFWVVDETTGEEQYFPGGGGTADLRQWRLPPVAQVVNLSVTRWNHELWLHQSNGESSPLARGNLQGSWSQSWFTTYQYFDASTQVRSGLEWWIYDVTTGEISPPNTADLAAWVAADVNADADGDGLPDWYEFIIGTTLQSPDSDGDGLPDGWEVRYGLQPTAVDDPSSDEDKDGLSLIAEYQAGTSPDNADTDGDGADDLVDRFPKDDRRSEPIPFAHYSTIELAPDLPGIHNVSSVVINNAGQAAFLSWDGTNVWRHVWRDGSLIANHPFPSFSDSGIGVGSINGAGTVAGLIYEQMDFDGTSEWIIKNGFVLTAGGMSEFEIPWPSGSYIGIDWIGISESGVVFGPMYAGYLGGFMGLPGAVKSYTPSTWEEDAFEPYAISPNGLVAVGRRRVAGESEYDQELGISILQAGAWSNFLRSPGPYSNLWYPHPYAINDQAQVVGLSDRFDTAGYPLGMFYGSVGGSAPAFHLFPDILPTKYRKQLRSAIPYLITNANPDTGKPTIGFRAESLEGESEGEWNVRDFQLSWADAATPLVKEILVTDTPNIQITTLNDDSNFAGMTQTGAAVLGNRCEFRAKNINLGFDPPIQGDPPQVGPKDKDTANPQWWTLVSRKTDNSLYHRNDNVQVVFNSDNSAKLYKAVVAADSTTLITLEGDNANHGIPLTEAVTDLVIIGQEGAVLKEPKEAKVEIWPINGNPTRAVCTLHVYVMTERHINLAIWRVSDSLSPLTTLPSGLPDDARIIAKMNQIFRQACILFEPNSHSRALDIPYDKPSSRDGKLDYNVSAERTAIESNSQISSAGAHLNLVIVRCRAGKSIFGFTQGISSRFVYVLTDRFELWPNNFHPDGPSKAPDFDEMRYTCAHEAGHALHISTRNAKDTNLDILQHDFGVFPHDYRYDITQGIMTSNRSPGKEPLWMRQEDWKAANMEAGRRLSP